MIPISLMSFLMAIFLVTKASPLPNKSVLKEASPPVNKTVLKDEYWADGLCWFNSKDMTNNFYNGFVWEVCDSNTCPVDRLGTYGKKYPCHFCCYVSNKGKKDLTKEGNKTIIKVVKVTNGNWMVIGIIACVLLGLVTAVSSGVLIKKRCGNIYHSVKTVVELKDKKSSQSGETQNFYPRGESSPSSSSYSVESAESDTGPNGGYKDTVAVTKEKIPE